MSEYIEDLSPVDLLEFRDILRACETPEQGHQTGCMLTEEELERRMEEDSLPAFGIVKFKSGRFGIGMNTREGWAWLIKNT